MNKALDNDFAATCSATQFVSVLDEVRSCNDCPALHIRDPESVYKCLVSCADYTYVNAEKTACVSDTCSVYEKLLIDGTCGECAQASMPTQPAVSLAKLTLINASQSSDWCCAWRSNMLTADQALTDDVSIMSHTKPGRGHWWMAAFEAGTQNVSEVRITNRADCCGDRLAGYEVWIGDKKCGVLPDSTAKG